MDTTTNEMITKARHPSTLSAAFAVATKTVTTTRRMNNTIIKSEKKNVSRSIIQKNKKKACVKHINNNKKKKMMKHVSTTTTTTTTTGNNNKSSSSSNIVTPKVAIRVVPISALTKYIMGQLHQHQQQLLSFVGYSSSTCNRIDDMIDIVCKCCLYCEPFLSFDNSNINNSNYNSNNNNNSNSNNKRCTTTTTQHTSSLSSSSISSVSLQDMFRQAIDTQLRETKINYKCTGYKYTTTTTSTSTAMKNNKQNNNNSNNNTRNIMIALFNIVQVIVEEYIRKIQVQQLRMQDVDHPEQIQKNKKQQQQPSSSSGTNQNNNNTNTLIISTSTNSVSCTRRSIPTETLFDCIVASNDNSNSSSINMNNNDGKDGVCSNRCKSNIPTTITTDTAITMKNNNTSTETVLLHSSISSTNSFEYENNNNNDNNQCTISTTRSIPPMNNTNNNNGRNSINVVVDSMNSCNSYCHENSNNDNNNSSTKMMISPSSHNKNNKNNNSHVDEQNTFRSNTPSLSLFQPSSQLLSQQQQQHHQQQQQQQQFPITPLHVAPPPPTTTNISIHHHHHRNHHHHHHRIHPTSSILEQHTTGAMMVSDESELDDIITTTTSKVHPRSIVTNKRKTKFSNLHNCNNNDNYIAPEQQQLLQTEQMIPKHVTILNSTMDHMMNDIDKTIQIYNRFYSNFLNHFQLLCMMYNTATLNLYNATNQNITTTVYQQQELHEVPSSKSKSIFDLYHLIDPIDLYILNNAIKKTNNHVYHRSSTERNRTQADSSSYINLDAIRNKFYTEFIALYKGNTMTTPKKNKSTAKNQRHKYCDIDDNLQIEVVSDRYNCVWIQMCIAKCSNNSTTTKSSCYNFAWEHNNKVDGSLVCTKVMKNTTASTGMEQFIIVIPTTSDVPLIQQQQQQQQQHNRGIIYTPQQYVAITSSITSPTKKASMKTKQFISMILCAIENAFCVMDSSDTTSNNNSSNIQGISQRVRLADNGSKVRPKRDIVQYEKCSSSINLHALFRSVIAQSTSMSTTNEFNYLHNSIQLRRRKVHNPIKDLHMAATGSSICDRPVDESTNHTKSRKRLFIDLS